MKKIKYILLGLLLFAIPLMITNAFSMDDYNSLYNQVKEKTCDYQSSGDGNIYGFDKLEFTFTSEGLKFKAGDFNGLVYGKNVGKGEYINGIYTDFGFGKEFLEIFKSNSNTCPGDIYVGLKGTMQGIYTNIDITQDSVVIFKPPKVEVEGKDCHYPGAEKCKRFEAKATDGHMFYLEIGTYASGTRAYLGVSTNPYRNNLQTSTVDISDRSEISVQSDNGKTFMVENKAFSELWLSNGNLISGTPFVRPGDDNGVYYISGTEANNSGGNLYGDTITEESPDKDPEYGTYKDPYEEQKPLEIKPIHLCTKGSGGLKVMQIVGYVLYIMKILVPLILIIMASVDLAKGVITSNEKPNAEVIKKLIIRVLIGIIIFIIPTVLDFLLSFVDGASGTMDNDGKFTKCTDCLLDPFGDCTK